MKKTTQHRMVAGQWLALAAVLTGLATAAQAQVTFEQVTNGLVSVYPLDQVVTNGSTLTTPDHLGGRDLILSPAVTSGNLVTSDRPSGNPTSVSNCFNLSQIGGATVVYYNSKGQDALTGGGDFLPFCNQINATMNFWIKANSPATGTDTRFFGECDTTGGQANPLYLWGDHGTAAGKAHLLFRQEQGTGPNGTIPMTDGTFQLPVPGYHMAQDNTWTSNSVLDGVWHMFTITIDSNASVAVYVDGIRDPGAGTGAWLDAYGNASACRPHPLTNVYYTTNIYPAAGVSNPPPNGFVRWMFNATFKTGSTTFGGFKRGGITGGIASRFDDVAFWNRVLNEEEINFVRTNGMPGIPLVRPLILNSFTADYHEVGKGSKVTLRWNVTGASTTPGSITISGVGDVTALGLIGTTNVTITGEQTFTLTAKNGIAPDVTADVTVKSFAGVDTKWNLIQRFDGLFDDNVDDPAGGINGHGWISSGSDFSGSFDKWNVLTMTNGGGQNKVMTPRTGYVPGTTITGFQSRGALSYASLGSLTMPPNRTNTLFFRFSLHEGGIVGAPSDLDLNIGLTDYNFIGPGGGTGGGLGPFFTISRFTGGAFSGGPFNLTANDIDEATDTVTNTFNYINSVDAAGIVTNVNYLVWLDVVNRNTHGLINAGVTNTVDQALYSVWIQKQGDPSRTLLFSGFHGNRNYGTYNPANDLPAPSLDKAFFNITPYDLGAVTSGAYFGTNMVAIDDIYMSTSGTLSTIPRLFDLTSIIRSASSVTISWNSLGSLHQVNTYTIQRKQALTDANWTTLATGVPSGGSTTTYIDNTAGALDTAYYRILWP